MLSYCFVLLLFLGASYGDKYRAVPNITNAEYFSMPSVFHLDDYAYCMSLNEQSLYCNAEIQLSPARANSEIWKIIEEVISVPRYYRHDLLRHGICVAKSCPRIHVSKRNNTDDPKFWAELSHCYTQKYKADGLKCEVKKLHCEHNDSAPKIDTVHYIFTIAFGIWMLFNIIGTGYDVWARNVEYEDNEKYEQLISGSTTKDVIMAFALGKNWDRLRKKAEPGDGEALSVLQGIKVKNAASLLFVHTVLTSFVGPVWNTDYVEGVTLKPQNMLIQNGHVGYQTSLVISAWLMSYAVCQMFDNRKISLRDLFFIYVNRLIRLVPLYLLALGFAATWFPYLGKGPVWNRIVGTEYENCRENWLLNLLFVNNYFNVERPCMQHTWYMAVEMQLFVLGLFVMMMIINHQKHANKIFAFFIVSGILITFSQHYYNEYDIIFRSFPENLHQAFQNDKAYQNMFIPMQHHISSYVWGLALGYYFYKSRKQSSKLELSTKVVWLIGILGLSLSTGTILYPYRYHVDGSSEYTRFEAAFYQAISRFAFAFPVSSMIYLLTIGYGGSLIGIFKYKPLQPVGRLTYSVYLFHTFIMRMRSGFMMKPEYVSNVNLICTALADIGNSYLIAAVMCLLVEMPISALKEAYTTHHNKQAEKKEK